MNLRRLGLGAAFALAATIYTGTAEAQLRDVTQIGPTVAGGAINKSLAQEIGAGRGDVITPDSSLFIIERDPFRAIRRGRQLFQRKFTVAQGFGPRTDDGIGNIELVGGDPTRRRPRRQLRRAATAGRAARPASAATSSRVPTAATRPTSSGSACRRCSPTRSPPTCARIRAEAIDQARERGRRRRCRCVAKGISFGIITANPDGTVDTSGVEGVDPDLRVRPFFAQGGTISIREFVVGAFNAEMGLEAPDPDLILRAPRRRRRGDAGRHGARRRASTHRAPPVGAHRGRRSGRRRRGQRDPDEHRRLHGVLPAQLLQAGHAGEQTDRPAATMGRRLFTSIGCAELPRPRPARSAATAASPTSRRVRPEPARQSVQPPVRHARPRSLDRDRRRLAASRR